MDMDSATRIQRLARAFGRALDAELPSLPPDAVLPGEMLRRFLPTMEKADSFRHPGTRADMLRTLDEFARLRKPMRTAS